MKWMQVGMVDTLLPRGGFGADVCGAAGRAGFSIRALADSGADLNAQDHGWRRRADVRYHQPALTAIDVLKLALQHQGDPNARQKGDYW